MKIEMKMPRDREVKFHKNLENSREMRLSQVTDKEMPLFVALLS